MQVYTRIQRVFPGGAGPAVVVVSARDVTQPQVTAGIAALKRAALASGRMHEPITVEASTSHRAARVLIPLDGKGTDAASNRALDTLRGQVIPATLGKVPGVTARTTGWTAGSRDFNDSMKAHAPLVFAFVLGLAFVLLLVTFRSIVIPLKAIALNLLSVGAAYGVLVLVFQQGHLESLLGFTSIGGVTAWLPLFLFVILFGLSMDYHVLILSRVREFHDAGMSTDDAVAHGIRATAGVVTSAALVMVGAFAIFATLGMIDFKMMGVGLAVAVLIDATIVRAVLLPATMKLLGDWNWYLPRWLEWLPRLGRQAPPRAHTTPDADARAADPRPRLTRHSALAMAADNPHPLGVRLRMQTGAPPASLRDGNAEHRRRQPWSCIGFRSARVVARSASTAGSSRPSQPRASIGAAATSTTLRSSSTWTAIATRSSSRRRRTLTRRVAAWLPRAPSGAATSAGCACFATRSAAGAAARSPISARRSAGPAG